MRGDGISSELIYLTTALLLFSLALTALLLTHHLIRKVLAFNVMASSVFLLLVVLAYRPDEAGAAATADPVPQALVLTGIVVSFSASAITVALARRIHAATGEARLPEEKA